MIRQPTETVARKLPLEGLRVCISGAVPERRFCGQALDLDRLILTFVSQLSALVIRYGGNVVHGSQPSLTPVVGQIPEVTRRAASMAQAEVVVTEQIGNGDARDPKTRNQSLTAMRLAMTQQV